MPNTYTQLLFHVVFSTKNRERTITNGKRFSSAMDALSTAL